MNKSIFTICKTLDEFQYFKDAINTLPITWTDIDDFFSRHDILNVELIRESKISIPKQGLFQQRNFILQNIMTDASFCITRFFNVNARAFDLWETMCDAYPGQGVDFHVFGGISERAKSFPAHCDLAINYIVQLHGQCEWTIYNERASYEDNYNYNLLPEHQLTVQTKVLLSPGDALYIPSGKYHACKPLGKRLSLSIPIL